MRGPVPRVFTIPPGASFLPTLADALLDGSLVGDVPLGEALVYLPTRRAARAFAATLSERHGGRALLLPRIVPLGEADEAEWELSGILEGAEPLLPPIPPLERRLILTRLIQAWSAQVDRELLRLDPGSPFLVPASPADAVGLAGDLETLMDALTTEGLPWDDLAAAVETDYSHYFELTLRFLRVAAENWPGILAGRGASDPARRQGDLLRAEAERLRRERPTTPIVAAGSTGSIPGTAALLAAIAGLPKGAVVLPGLDTDLDEAGWTGIGRIAEGEFVHGHPQATLRRLLDAYLKVDRSAVTALGTPGKQARMRARMVSEALRPAETTDRWADLAPAARARIVDEGASGLAIVEAADEREEALAAAVALRETLETPGRTAILITPDRGLAVRVAAELARWDVAVEDSAGTPLPDTRAGRLARLAADAAVHDFHPTRVLALLAHPDVRLGLSRAEVERGAAALEIGTLRGPAPGPGPSGLARALAAGRDDNPRHAPRPRKRLTPEDWDLAARLVNGLAGAFTGFSADDRGEDELDLMELADAHRRTVDALREPASDEADQPADRGEEALATLFDDLAMADDGPIRGRLPDYPAFFAALARLRVVPPVRATGHRRVRILGLLEARLLDADRVVLGGLDEGVWPPRAQTDAFLNRPMRAKVGLSPPERRIGQSAHDWAQALGVADAVITRAHKRDGQPTVPSRFLQRLKAFAGEAAWGRMTTGGRRFLHLARALDARPAAPPLRRPAPRPSPALFPRALSVTEIETLIRDPYAIFARHVLGLDALEPIATVPSAASRGSLVHEALARFAAAFPTGLPAHPEAELLQIGLDLFGPLADSHPELHAEWWPRFLRLSGAFLRWEGERRGGLRHVHAEASGSWSFPLGDGSTFTLRARADRIEAGQDGGRVIVDFKTGQPPTAPEVFAGFAPQLTLEAAMLKHGAFRDVGGTTLPDLLYIHASGGREPLKPRPVEPPRGEARTVAALVAEHERRLRELLDRFVAGEAGYPSRPYPKYARRWSPYDHLARVKEWSLAGEGGGEDAT